MPRLFKLAALVTALSTAVTAQTLNVVNNCGEQVFLFTQTSVGTIANNLFVNPGATQNMGISPNWDGAINVGNPHLVPTTLALVDVAHLQPHAQVVHYPLVEEDVPTTHSLDHTATSSSTTALTHMHSPPTMVQAEELQPTTWSPLAPRHPLLSPYAPERHLTCKQLLLFQVLTRLFSFIAQVKIIHVLL
ncbi:hypothetical protein Clacol_008582 [Clathrus columnatus]|uniref:Uncharacterized protein n=1 Tax=Clathrus columnatus TaxID=1419009 RepID=A0AAV5AMN0_9AGAM|nr:hypothetical protein Clacol_008582 [Clathrus columnatus]